MSLFSALGRAVGAIGRGASYLRRQSHGYTPEYERAMRDSYLRALLADEEERQGRREDREGRREDRTLRRESNELERTRLSEADRQRRMEKALDYLPSVLQAEEGPMPEPDYGQIARVTGLREDEVGDAVATTRRRLEAAAGARGTAERQKKTDESERDARELRQAQDMARLQHGLSEAGRIASEGRAAGRDKKKDYTRQAQEELLRLATTPGSELPSVSQVQRRAEELKALDQRLRLAGDVQSHASERPDDPLWQGGVLDEQTAPAPGGATAGPPPDWPVPVGGKPVPYSQLPPELKAKADARWAAGFR